MLHPDELPPSNWRKPTAIDEVCPECGSAMEKRGAVDHGDEEGRGGSDLFQCPACKEVKIR